MIIWLASYPKSGNTLLRSILATYFFSKDLSILKYSVPNFVYKNKKLMKIVNEITDAKIEDGGSGAFYIYLKKNKNL